MRQYDKGTVALHLELIGFRAGEDHAELLGVFVDVCQFEEIATESPRDEWCLGFDRYEVVLPGQQRPADVRETHRTEWLLPGLADFHAWLAAWSAADAA